MLIKSKTTDEELARVMNEEELLLEFARVKKLASQYDTARDRLRKYIQVNIEEGVHNKVILEKPMSGARVYATSAGLAHLKETGDEDLYTEKASMTIKITVIPGTD